MNVYDFDKTIYKGDSTLDFYFFCIRKQRKLLRYVPKQCRAFLQYKLDKISKTDLKECFFSFLNSLESITDLLEAFWDKYESSIALWYLGQQKEDDVVISASPVFLLKPICDRIGIKTLIASIVEPTTGKFVGLNCYGEEKLKRFRETFGNEAVDRIDHFYSDSRSDMPLAQKAKQSFLVKKGEIFQWDM